MGRQVNFYMHPKDEVEFVRRRCNDCKFLLTRHPSPVPQWLDELPVFGPEGCQFSWQFSWSVLLGKPEMGGPMRAQLIKSQGYFDVDAFEYELVEFSRCGLAGGELSRGRLWFSPAFWLPPKYEVQPKSAEFVRWANSLLVWIQRHYSRNEIGVYFGPHAKEWAAQGGQLVGWPVLTRDPE